MLVAVPAVSPEAVPVQFVSTPEVGVPSRGVTRVGLACMTKVDPVPVWAATAVVFPLEVIGPLRLALVVTVAELPVQLPELPEVLAALLGISPELRVVPAVTRP
jgi:hypothetical protein